jgi:transposase-like protein
VITGVSRHRRWPRSEKARIVAEGYAPDASAVAVAVRQELHRNQIFAWRGFSQPSGGDRQCGVRLGPGAR